MDEPLVRPLGRVLAVMSGANGMGTTTFAVHLATGMSQRGLKVGLFDFGFTGTATQHLSCRSYSNLGTDAASLYGHDIEDFRSSIDDPLDVVRFQTHIERHRLEVGLHRLSVTRRLFDAARRVYDVVIVDTPHNCTIQLAVTALCDYVVFALGQKLDSSNSVALSRALDTCSVARDNCNSRLRSLGVLVADLDKDRHRPSAEFIRGCMDVCNDLSCTMLNRECVVPYDALLRVLPKLGTSVFDIYRQPPSQSGRALWQVVDLVIKQLSDITAEEREEDEVIETTHRHEYLTGYL